MRIASPERSEERGFRLAYAAYGGAPGRYPALEVIYEMTSTNCISRHSGERKLATQARVPLAET
jgi:hypothetical protein